MQFLYKGTSVSPDGFTSVPPATGLPIEVSVPVMALVCTIYTSLVSTDGHCWEHWRTDPLCLETITASCVEINVKTMLLYKLIVVT